MIEHATEIRMLAEIRASELLREMEKNKGARSNPNGRGAKIVRSPKETTQPATLSELGVTKDQSSRWQRGERNRARFLKMAVFLPSRGDQSRPIVAWLTPNVRAISVSGSPASQQTPQFTRTGLDCEHRLIHHREVAGLARRIIVGRMGYDS